MSKTLSPFQDEVKGLSHRYVQGGLTAEKQAEQLEDLAASIRKEARENQQEQQKSADPDEKIDNKGFQPSDPQMNDGNGSAPADTDPSTQTLDSNTRGRSPGEQNPGAPQGDNTGEHHNPNV